MKFKILFAVLFVFLALLIAFAIKPKSNEMLYVYEKTNNFEKAREEYKKILDESPEDMKTTRKLVDNLYATRDKNYIAASIEYYEKHKDYEIIRRIIDGYKANNDFESSLKWLNTAYNDFNKIEDLEEFLKIAAFISKTDSQIFALKKLYELTNDKELLYTLYGINEKEYALNELYKLEEEKKLNTKEAVQLIKFSIYEHNFEKAYDIYLKYDLLDLDPYHNKKEYEFLLNSMGSTEDLENFYYFLYKNNKSKFYYDEYKNYLLTEGEIDKFLDLSKETFSKNENKKVLDEIIQYSYLNDDIEQYLEFLSKKAINEKDITVSESIIAYYIDLGNEEKLNQFLEKLDGIGKNFSDFTKLILNTYTYLGEDEKAEKKLMQFYPQEVTADVVYSVFHRKINEKSMPYFMYILKDSNDKYTKSKLFSYRYKLGQLFTDETYHYFGKPTTFRKLNQYIEHFEKKIKIKKIIDFANESSDPQFIAEIAQQLLFLNKKDEAINFFEKALSIYPSNKLALKTLGIIEVSDNKLDSALEHLSKLKELDKNDYEIDNYLGDIAYYNKNFDQSKKYYKTVIENLKPKNLSQEYMILKSKSRIENATTYNNEFEKLFEKSKNDLNLLADIWSIYFQNKEYDYLLNQFDLKKEFVEKNDRLKEIELNTYMAIQKYDIAKEKLNQYIKKEKISSKTLANFYEKIAYIELQNNNKKEALDNYENSLKQEKNSELEQFVQNLRKDFRTRFNFSIGIRNKIEEGSIGIRSSYEKVKFHLIEDIYDDYNSPKILLSDLNENYTIGVGKDFKFIKINNILNKKISIFFKESIDTNSTTTIEKELIYKNYGLEFNHNFNDKVYYNLKLSKFDYKDGYDFSRKRVENNFYIPIISNYFGNISYVLERVDNINAFGYEDLNSLSLSFGESNKINDKFSYYYSLGGEFKSSKINLLSNIDFIYEDKDSNISLRNSFSKDDLTNQYNFTNLLFYEYFF